MTRITDATVLVTGAASGIGRGLCIALAAEGARVIGVDRNTEGLDELAAQLGDAFISRICDLADTTAIEGLAHWVENEVGPVGILINNAGVVSGSWLEETPAASIETTFRVNALAPIHLTRALLPGMLARDQGHVVTIASAAGIVGTAKLVDYSASKAAAVGFDEALRLELKRRGSAIRTTVVCPYFVDTGMFEGVRTRWRWLLPILKPESVVRRTLRAIRRNRARVVMPWLVKTAWPARLLPTFLFDALMNALGITRSMDHFRGRTGNDEEPSDKD